jgi:CBS domain-containing protein
MEDRAPVTDRGGDMEKGGSVDPAGEKANKRMHQDLIDDLTERWKEPPGEQAVLDFTEACRRVDSDPRERQRIRDIVGLIDADDVIYGQAVAAVDRGDLDTAVPLLRHCAATGIGESAWLLAGALEELGSVAEAADWYARAADDGDERARARISAPIRAQAQSRGEPVTGGNGALGSGLARVNAADRDCPAKSLAGAWTAAHVDLFFVVDANVMLALADDARCAHCVADARVYTGRPWTNQVEYGYWSRPVPGLPDTRLGTLRVWGGDAGSVAWVAQVKQHDARARLSGRAAVGPRWATAGRGPNTAAFWLADAAARAAALGSGGSCLACEQVPLLKACGSCAPRASGGGQTAREVMLPLSAIPVLTPDTTVHEALEEMLRSGARALPVRDGPDVAGVVTLADLALRMHRAYGAPSIQRVGTLMHQPSAVPSDMPTTAVMSIAAEDQAGLLIVTRADGTPVGYLTHQALLNRTPRAVASGANQTAAQPFLVVPGENGLLQATVR